jgi:ferric-dicitrate binding protein FerR (iron transport regulator)
VAALEGEVWLRDGRERRLLAVGDALPVGAALETGAGRVALARPGGGSLRLDRGSRLAWLAVSRVRLSAGAVYLDSSVAVDGQRTAAPLAVESPLGQVTEVGTRFEVRILDGLLRVRVRAGEVELAATDISARAGRGEELRWAPAAGRLERASVAPADLSWEWVQQVSPPVELGGRTLAEILAWTEAETGIEVTWAEPALERRLAGQRLEGSWIAARPPEALAAVQPVFGLRPRIEGERLVVEAR